MDANRLLVCAIQEALPSTLRCGKIHRPDSGGPHGEAVMESKTGLAQPVADAGASEAWTQTW